MVLVANNRYQSFQWFWSARCAGEELLPDLAFDFLLIEGRLLCFTPRQHARSLCRHPCVPFPSVSTLMAPKAKSVEEGYYYCRERKGSLLSVARPSGPVMRFTILQLFVAFAVVSSIKAMALPAAEDQTDLDDAEWLKMLSEDSSKLEKRKFGPNDPRSLFQAAYSDYR